MVIQGHVISKNDYIYSAKVHMATILGRMITYLSGLLPKKSHDPFMKRCWEIMWQTKPSIFSIPQYLWSGNLLGWWPSFNDSFWSRDLVRSRGKLKLLYFHYYSVYEHQTWQEGDLPWGAPIIKVTSLFNHVVLLDHMINYKHISTTAKPKATKVLRLYY